MNGYSNYLPPRFIQIVGVLLLIGATVFWAVTGRESAYLFSSAVSLILLGEYKRAVDSLKKNAPSGNTSNGNVGSKADA
jgi:hypothetical protein